jgi:hypothetical protein
MNYLPSGGASEIISRHFPIYLGLGYARFVVALSLWGGGRLGWRGRGRGRFEWVGTCAAALCNNARRSSNPK